MAADQPACLVNISSHGAVALMKDSEKASEVKAAGRQAQVRRTKARAKLALPAPTRVAFICLSWPCCSSLGPNGGDAGRSTASRKVHRGSPSSAGDGGSCLRRVDVSFVICLPVPEAIKMSSCFREGGSLKTGTDRKQIGLKRARVSKGGTGGRGRKPQPAALLPLTNPLI